LAGDLPHTLLGELTVLPQTSYLDYRGPTSKGGKRNRRRREGRARKRTGEEERAFPLL